MAYYIQEHRHLILGRKVKTQINAGGLVVEIIEISHLMASSFLIDKGDPRKEQKKNISS